MKPYIYAAAALALMVSHWWMYRHGLEVCEGRAKDAVIQHRDAENKKVIAHQANQAKQEIIYRDRIKIIQAAPDPTRCADVDIAPDICRVLGDACRR